MRLTRAPALLITNPTPPIFISAFGPEFLSLTLSAIGHILAKRQKRKEKTVKSEFHWTCLSKIIQYLRSLWQKRQEKKKVRCHNGFCQYCTTLTKSKIPMYVISKTLKCLFTLYVKRHKLHLQDLAFFDRLPTSVYIFYCINVYKKSIFLTTYPTPPVNVVCETPQR